MSLFTTAQTVSMIQATGGVAVVDVAAAETTYGHKGSIPRPYFEDSEYGRVAGSRLFVDIAAEALTNVGIRDGQALGISRALTVDGDDREIVDVVECPSEPNGDMIRVLLAEA